MEPWKSDMAGLTENLAACIEIVNRIMEERGLVGVDRTIASMEEQFSEDAARDE